MNDVVIVGGGIVGSLLMLILKNLGYKALLIEKKAEIFQGSDLLDVRNFALSRASKQMLEALNLWQELKTVTPIYKIQVSQQGYFGTASFDNKGKPLGYVVAAHELHSCIAQKLQDEDLVFDKIIKVDPEKGVIYLENQKELQAKILIAADGAQSLVRTYCKIDFIRESYNQAALVTNIKFSKDHNYEALERFTRQGLLALLPMQDKYMALIWANEPQESKRLAELSNQDFFKNLHETFGYKFGSALELGKRHIFNLEYLVMQELYYEKVIFIGSAASSLHPVAGQGLNLAMRDLSMLVECFVEHGLNTDTLALYANKRSLDRKVIAKSTNGIINIFKSKLPFAGLLRSTGLMLLDNVPMLKNNLAHYASGFGGSLSKLICGIEL